MNIEFATDILGALAVVLLAANNYSQTRITERMLERHRALMRRVWILEGSPRGDGAPPQQERIAA